jgi:hypothetical protein
MTHQPLIYHTADTLSPFLPSCLQAPSGRLLRASADGRLLLRASAGGPSSSRAPAVAADSARDDTGLHASIRNGGTTEIQKLARPSRSKPWRPSSSSQLQPWRPLLRPVAAMAAPTSSAPRASVLLHWFLLWAREETGGGESRWVQTSGLWVLLQAPTVKP